MTHLIMPGARPYRIAVVLAVAVAGARADTITVCWDGSGDYTTIQAGIDAAEDGDEVVVCEGTYTGPGNRDLDFGGKATTVRSTDPEDPDVVAATIIDCQGSEVEPHRGFKFHSSEGPDSIVAGLTVTNGYGPQDKCYWGTRSAGGAIYCMESSPTITDCVLRQNQAGGSGAAILFYLSEATIRDCTIAANADYCAISCGDSPVTVSDCVIRGNQGYGLYCYGTYSGALTVDRCVISGNNGGILTRCPATCSSLVSDSGGTALTLE